MTDLKQILRELRAQGWRVEMRKGSHWKLAPPNGGPIVFCSSTPSDWRAIHHIRADCRRAAR